jgi:hypothetical protein
MLSLVSIAAAALLGACVVVVSGPTTWTPASPDPGVVNLSKATFASNSGVTEAVLAECGLDRKIPQMIARWSPVPTVLAEQSVGGGRVLTLQVTQILAPGGGPKSVTMHGELQEARSDGWQTIASFDVRRTTTRGGRTCEMLDIIVDAMAKDIRPWLASPTLNAPLGEL